MNWVAWKRPVVVGPSSPESDIEGQTARELSDDMSALLYNLDSTITLRASGNQIRVSMEPVLRDTECSEAYMAI